MYYCFHPLCEWAATSFYKGQGLFLFHFLDLRIWWWYKCGARTTQPTGGLMVRHQSVILGLWWQKSRAYQERLEETWPVGWEEYWTYSFHSSCVGAEVKKSAQVGRVDWVQEDHERAMSPGAMIPDDWVWQGSQVNVGITGMSYSGGICTPGLGDMISGVWRVQGLECWRWWSKFIKWFPNP